MVSVNPVDTSGERPGDVLVLIAEGRVSHVRSASEIAHAVSGIARKPKQVVLPSEDMTPYLNLAAQSKTPEVTIDKAKMEAAAETVQRPVSAEMTEAEFLAKAQADLNAVNAQSHPELNYDPQ